jgi:hypothetical protein
MPLRPAAAARTSSITPTRTGASFSSSATWAALRHCLIPPVCASSLAVAGLHVTTPRVRPRPRDAALSARAGPASPAGRRPASIRVASSCRRRWAPAQSGRALPPITDGDHARHRRASGPGHRQAGGQEDRSGEPRQGLLRSCPRRTRREYRRANRGVPRDRPVAASYCSATPAGIRPRSLTGMPWAFAHARMLPLRWRADVVRAGRRCCPRPALRACSTKGASPSRNFRAFLLLRSISYSEPPIPNRNVSSAGLPSRSSSSATAILVAIPASMTARSYLHGTDRVSYRGSPTPRLMPRRNRANSPQATLAPAEVAFHRLRGGLADLARRDLTRRRRHMTFRSASCSWFC